MFSLPLKENLVYTNIRSRHHSSLPRKRKRSNLPSEDSQDDSTDEREQYVLTAASANPLSLTPAEVSQYKLAGLDLNQPLPSKSNKFFPYGPLPSTSDEREHTADEESLVESEQHSRSSRSASQGRSREPSPRHRPHLRQRHLAVLTTLLHRCLMVNDIPRATRAWSMILRTQIGGKGIDLRHGGYWGIGAELLVRAGETGPERHRPVISKDSYSDESSSDSESHKIEEAGEFEDSTYPSRWGSATGLERLKEYYERLILQHPHKRQFADSINAVDFWPSMLGCEIYGIQYEHLLQMQKLAKRKIADDIRNNDDEEDSGSDLKSLEDQVRLPSSRYEKEQRKLEDLWEQSEAARKKALAATVAISQRMDELMATPPYSDIYPLLKLRAMLALYSGDLSVPDTFEDASDTVAEPSDGDESHHEQEEGYFSKTRYRLLVAQRRAERERCLQTCLEHRAKARSIFEKIIRDGGDKEGEILALYRNINQEENETDLTCLSYISNSDDQR